MELLTIPSGPCKHVVDQPADGKAGTGSGQVDLRWPLLTLLFFPFARLADPPGLAAPLRGPAPVRWKLQVYP